MNTPALNELVIAASEFDYRVKEVRERLDNEIIRLDLKVEVAHTGRAADTTRENMEKPKHLLFIELFD